ncbi:unnamed protein product [Pieris brassicae]|uniref:Uncharacterized protein n=1 Tax=Pieris brassicae TaxID=7116 RepID=A0A9P0TPT1_PIEBR|nr:unnamed protein product [Pieris brassicae]
MGNTDWGQMLEAIVHRHPRPAITVARCDVAACAGNCLRRARAAAGACPPAPRRQLLRTGGACGNSTALRVPTIARPPLPI